MAGEATAGEDPTAALARALPQGLTQALAPLAEAVAAVLAPPPPQCPPESQLLRTPPATRRAWNATPSPRAGAARRSRSDDSLESAVPKRARSDTNLESAPPPAAPVAPPLGPSPTKQSNLAELWGSHQPTDDIVAASPYKWKPLQTNLRESKSHKKLLESKSHQRESVAQEFERERKAEEEQRKRDIEELRARRKREIEERRARAEERERGGILLPDQRGRGVPRGKKRGGRSTGSNRTAEQIKRHKRDLGGPTLRRDPTAPEKLNVVSQWDTVREECGCETIAQIPSDRKRQLEADWHYLYDTVQGWAKRRVEFGEYIVQSRIGKWGPRPFGSTRATSEGSKARGARMSRHTVGESTTLRPLEELLARFKKWFEHEREHRHEVRGTVLRQRLKYELEYERDMHLLFKEKGDERFKQFVVDHVSARLKKFNVTCSNTRQEQ